MRIRNRDEAVRQDEQGIELSVLLYRLLDKFPLVIVFALVCGILLSLYAVIGSRTYYVGVSEVYVVPNIGGFETVTSQNIQLANMIKGDFVAAVTNRQVHQNVIESLALPYTPESMEGRILASYSENTSIIEIRAVSTNPQEAVSLANAYADESAKFMEELLNLTPVTRWEYAATPEVTRSMSGSTYFRYGFLGGAAAAMVLVILWILMDDRVRTPEDLESYFGLPVLGALTQQRDRPVSRNDGANARQADKANSMIRYARIVQPNAPDSRGQEMLNTICANLMFAHWDKRVLAVTSCGSGEGKSYLTMQMARTLAESGNRVVVVDGNLRQSEMLSQRGNNVGLGDFLSGKCKLEECLYGTNMDNVYLIPCLTGADNPIPLLGAYRFSALIDWLADNCDVVLIDTPQAGYTVDAATIAQHCDGIVLVTEYARTKKADLEETVSRLELSGCRILGCVINQVRFDSLLSLVRYRLLRKIR